MVSLRVGGLVRLLLVWFFPQGKPVSTSLTAVSQQGAYFLFLPHTCGSSLVFTVESADSGGGIGYVPSLHDAC